MTTKLPLLLFLSCLALNSMRAAAEADRLVDEGIEAYKAGNYDVAISKFTESIKLDPKNEFAYNDRALAYRDKGDHKAAIADFTAALQLKPGRFVYYNRGTAYSKSGEQDAAISDYTKALRLNPKEPQGRISCLVGRAHANFDKEEAALAMTDLNAAIKLGVKEPDAYVLRGILHKVNHDYDRSLADYEKAISMDTKDARCYEVAAYLLSVCPMPKFRDATKAVAYATKACELTNWKDSQHLETLAAAYAEANQFDEAIKWQRTAAEIDPKGVEYSRLDLYERKHPFRDLNRKEEPIATLDDIKDKIAIEIGHRVTAQFEVNGDQAVVPKIVPEGLDKPDRCGLIFDRTNAAACCSWRILFRAL